jgi:hypothetical protein
LSIAFSLFIIGTPVSLMMRIVARDLWHSLRANILALLMLRLDYAERASGFRDPASDWPLAISDLPANPVSSHVYDGNLATEVTELLLEVIIQSSCCQYVIVGGGKKEAGKRKKGKEDI